ncbi:MAG: LpqB family beta-propeller domain-containing protein [Bifidobacteriaceae bacterium]|nr:LpqB family beta-propeller domain-containing protein [Bifidobacteriaceae bacterium]
MRPGRARAGAAALALALAWAAAGCANLPRSGEVKAGLEGIRDEAPYVRAVAAPPAPGASLEQIVEGFLQAMLAGATDDFKVARSYLQEGIAGVWDPSAGVVVYQSGAAPGLAQAGAQGAQMVLTVTQVAAVDAAGQYTALAARPWSETIDLEQDQAGEWRISDLPDGTVIPEDVFRADYLAVPLYFPSADGQFLVPDRRVFPRQSAATDAARQFLAGPPAYLGGAVGTVVPSGARLATDAVKVADGVAVVNLSEAMARASESARAAVHACLTAALTALPDVRSVALEVAGAPLEVQAGAGPAADPQAGAGLFYLGEGGVWRREGAEGALLEGTEAAAAWQALTVDHSGQRFAGLAAAGSLALLARAGGEAEVLALPPAQSAPSAAPAFDRLGWLWAAAGHQVAVFGSDGEAAQLEAAWLEGARVVALAPSRDGARLALAVEQAGAGEVSVFVAGIARGAGAAPWRLAGPLLVGRVPGPVGSLSWADGLTLALLAPAEAAGAATPALLTVGGDLVYLKSPTDPPVALAAGRGVDEVFATGQAGGLFAYSARGRVWSSLAGGARAVALPP